jgi:hypothetical protein
MIDSRSFLFITLDSCRFDTFRDSNIPNMKKIGPLHEAKAPSNFTFGSHSAMFVGFTPGIPTTNESFLNPKFGKIFKMTNAGFAGKGTEFLKLTGENIVQGFNSLGYTTIGTGAVGWFDPTTETGRVLGKDFEHFYYPGNSSSLEKQIKWIDSIMDKHSTKPFFVFINVGETHVPYYFEGAAWDSTDNPCVPFSKDNDVQKCRTRQKMCLEFIDKKINSLLEKFIDSSVLICADHGDCWGEDGLWEHGIHHEKVFTVPLLMRLVN